MSSARSSDKLSFVRYFKFEISRFYNVFYENWDSLNIFIVFTFIVFTLLADIYWVLSETSLFIKGNQEI